MMVTIFYHACMGLVVYVAISDPVYPRMLFYIYISVCPLALIVVVLYIFIADFPLQLSQFV